MKPRLALTCVLLASCTLGGSDEDPTNGLVAMNAPPVMDASSPSTADDGDDDDDDNGPGPIMSVDASSRDATTLSDATTVRDATVSDAGRRDASVVTVDAGGNNMCTPSSPSAVCDPVKNTGCSLFTQCDIDTAAKTPAGRCVFYSLSLGSSCNSSGLTTTCEGKSTCVDGTCRKTCYCDADCDTGTKCSGAAPGPEGLVKLCAP